MTNREINEALAKALGWTEILFHSDGAVDGYAPGATIHVKFSPATSVDALRKWVLPELERRGLDVDFMVKMHDIMMPTSGPLSWACLTADPAVLAAAALEVLEGK